MGLITKTRLKIPSGLKAVPRDYPIGDHTIVRSSAHIKKSKTGVPPMPQARVEEEGGDIEDEIDHFTIALEPLDQPLAQPSSFAPPRGPNRLDYLLAKIDQMSTVLDSHVQHMADQFAYIQGQITALSTQIEEILVDPGSNSESEAF